MVYTVWYMKKVNWQLVIVGAVIGGVVGILFGSLPAMLVLGAAAGYVYSIVKKGKSA